MDKKEAIKLFQDQKVRVLWDENLEKWFFSIVDVVGVLTDSPNPRKYWSVLKSRLKKEGSQLATNCSQLKMQSKDGKFYKTDVADTEEVLRLIQSIPSPKAEPFKLWLAKVGNERIEETEDPEKAFERAMETYLKKGYSTKELKNLKGLKKENLRDNMTNLELVLNMLAEATTTEISKEKKPKTFSQSKKIAQEGGTIAGNTRKEIEEKTGKKIISEQNAKKLKKDNDK